MNDANIIFLHQDEDSATIEIIAEGVPITPEILARKQTLAPWLIARDEYFRKMDLENPPEKPE